MCEHLNVIGHGLDRKGVQRLRCKDCGVTWVTWEKWGPKVYRLPHEKELLLNQLIEKGLSIRQIRAATGCAHITINRRQQAKHKTKVVQEPVQKGPTRCDYCGQEIAGLMREFYRRTSRTAHKFCDHVCYSAWQRAQRAQNRCKKCRRKRHEIGLCVAFSHGMCPHCYYLTKKESVS